LAACFFSSPQEILPAFSAHTSDGLLEDLLLPISKWFWLFAGLDFAILLGLFIVHLIDTQKQGSSSSFFGLMLYVYILTPTVVLLLALALFHFNTSFSARMAATAIAALPWMVILYFQAGRVAGRLSWRGQTSGWSYFSDSKQRELASAISGNSPQLEQIATSGVALNTPGRNGMTFLHLLLNNKAALDDVAINRIGTILLNAGADPNLPDEAGKTAPFYTTTYTKGLLRLMLEKGADPNRKSNEGKPLLFYFYDPEMLGLLIEKGADLNLTDSTGRPALIEFATREDWQDVLLLLENGADWRIVPAGKISFAERAGDGEGYAPDNPRRRVVEWLRAHPVYK
jgi:hypothetical protein